MQPRQVQPESIKIARIEKQVAQTQQTYELIGKLLDNPIVELIAWYFFVEYMRSHASNIFERVSDEVLSAAGVGVITAKAIAPLVPAMVQGAGGITDLVKSIAAIGAVAGA